MSTASQLLTQYKEIQSRNVSCLSEYETWLENVVEYLENEALNDNARGEEDPTTVGQLDFGFVLSEN